MDNRRHQGTNRESSSSETSNEEAEIVKHFEDGFRLLALRIARIIIQEFQRQAIGVRIDPRQRLARDFEFPFESRKLTFSVVEAAKLLGISRPAAYQAVSSNQIPSIRFGRRIVIPRAALERMLNEMGS